MPQPTSSEVHVNKPLTNISVAYIQDTKDFIANQVFPIVPVEKKSDIFFKFTKDHWFRSDMQKRADGTESAGSGYAIEEDTYSCDVWALHHNIGDQRRANEDSPLNSDRNTTQYLTQQYLLKLDQLFGTNYFVTSTWTGGTSGDFTPSTLWSAASSTPLEDVEGEGLAMKKKTGRKPNIMIVGTDVHKALKANAQIRDLYKYTRPGVMTSELMAQVFEMDKYIVAESVQNTAVEGAAFSGGFVFNPKDCLLLHAPANPGLEIPSAGYIFAWKGLLGSADGVRVSKFRMDHLKADRVEVETAFDMKRVATDLGVYFDGAVA